MRIRVDRQRLTDGSEVFDVVLISHDTRINLGAVTERDAHELADTLIEAITTHTNETITH
jgi:hypothetical protein